MYFHQQLILVVPPFPPSEPRWWEGAGIPSRAWTPHRIPFFFRRADVIPKLKLALQSRGGESLASHSPPAQTFLTAFAERTDQRKRTSRPAGERQDSAKFSIRDAARGILFSRSRKTGAPLSVGKGGSNRRSCSCVFVPPLPRRRWTEVSTSLSLCEALTVTRWKWRAR